jgi:hexosaminidase
MKIPMLKKHNKRLMGWEEIMTKDMSKDALSAWRGGNGSGGALITRKEWLQYSFV